MSQILLVEGKDDFHVLCSIFKKNKIKNCFDIIDKDGIDKLIVSIPIHLKTDAQTIGIIVDSDENLIHRWKSIADILTNHGYAIPTTVPTEGLIICTDELPKIGVWLMPDNNENGMLEDFVKQLISGDDKLLPYVEKALIEIEKLGLNKYKEIHKSKAKIHTWLSWQEDPGTPMGLAITKKYLDSENELCLEFLNWIKKLYY
jgi:hypothetical protein